MKKKRFLSIILAVAIILSMILVGCGGIQIGSPGPMGPQGPTGIQGETGPQGLTGADGTFPYIFQMGTLNVSCPQYCPGSQVVNFIPSFTKQPLVFTSIIDPSGITLNFRIVISDVTTSNFTINWGHSFISSNVTICWLAISG